MDAPGTRYARLSRPALMNFAKPRWPAQARAYCGVTAAQISCVCWAVLSLLMLGACEAPVTNHAQPIPGQLIVDPQNPAWLRYAGGGPAFICGPGDPEDFLYRGQLQADGTRLGDQDRLIDKLAGTGANSLYFQAVRSHGGDGEASHNPFRKHDPAQGLNPKVLDQWEQWFRRLDEHGIVIYFFFYDDGAAPWQTGNQMAAPERDFIAALVRRFHHHKHLVWVVAEEYSEALTPARVRQIAATIKENDPHGHVVAVHKLAGLDFSEFADDPHIDQFAIQTNPGTPREINQRMRQAWTDAAGRYNLMLAEIAEHGHGRSARLKNWAAAMGGAYVMVLGMTVDDTPRADLVDCGRLVQFMQDADFSRMTPRHDLAWQGSEYVLAAPAQHSYIVYASHLEGSHLGLRKMRSGVYDLDWLDINSGKRHQQTGLILGDGDQAWTKPAHFGNELAVHIHRSADLRPAVNHYPGARWETRPAAQLGLDPRLVDQAVQRLGGDGCIVRDGYLVKCWGEYDKVRDWGSAGKPLLSTLLLLAIHEGRLADARARLSEFGWTLSAKDQDMRLHHLANMTSGYARDEAPGAAWAYNDFAISLYARTLERIFGATLNQVARQRLQPLQLQDSPVFQSRLGYGVSLSVRDFARIAWLWLNQGRWRDATLIPAALFKTYCQAQVPGALPLSADAATDYLGVGTYGGSSDQTTFGPGIYGFNWWFNEQVGTSGRRMWPDAPPDTFQANGNWGRKTVTVIPSLNLVLVARSSGRDFEPGASGSRLNQVLKLLTAAVRERQ